MEKDSKAGGEKKDAITAANPTWWQPGPSSCAPLVASTPPASPGTVCWGWGHTGRGWWGVQTWFPGHMPCCTGADRGSWSQSWCTSLHLPGPTAHRSRSLQTLSWIGSTGRSSGNGPSCSLGQECSCWEIPGLPRVTCLPLSLLLLAQGRECSSLPSQQEDEDGRKLQW